MDNRGPEGKRTLRLYNVMFPIYAVFLMFPAVWLLALPVNFAIDSAVLLLAMGHYRYGGRKEVWKKSILFIWLLGFLADIAAAALITALSLLLMELLNLSLYTHWYVELLIALPGVALAGWLIYVLDGKFAFRKTSLQPDQRRKIAAALAIFTAPYTMLIPTALLYR